MKIAAKQPSVSYGSAGPDTPLQRLRHLLPWIVMAAVWATLASALPAPLVFYNPSPSLPIGYYLRAAAPPAKGRIIAFHVPALGRAYATAHIPYVMRGAIIKPVVAAAGDKVCADDQLTINGRILAPIAKLDRQGRALPQWRDCRVLRRDEYFVFSNRIPNSFDSRYYGPVAQTEVIGTFRPLWTRSAL